MNTSLTFALSFWNMWFYCKQLRIFCKSHQNVGIAFRIVLFEVMLMLFHLYQGIIVKQSEYVGWKCCVNMFGDLFLIRSSRHSRQRSSFSHDIRSLPSWTFSATVIFASLTGRDKRLRIKNRIFGLIYLYISWNSVWDDVVRRPSSNIQ
jgi:hypothetical protein